MLIHTDMLTTTKRSFT